mgnify:CR=1 FL=1
MLDERIYQNYIGNSERRNDSRNGMYRADRTGIWSCQGTRSSGKRTGTYHSKMQWKHYKKMSVVLSFQTPAD